MNATCINEIETPCELSKADRDHFRAQGYVKIKDLLSPETLAYYEQAITRKVFELNRTHEIPLEQRSTYDKAFLQVTNVLEHCETVRELVMSPRLGRLAAELMGTRGVRLYHDQALYKEAGGGHTPWHADQQYWPLASDRICTLWLPLQAVPLEMGPLAFAPGSHRFTQGRDLEISDHSEATLARLLPENGYGDAVEAFDLGEGSFHYGWTFHHAPPNRSGKPRHVMTVIYMDVDMRLQEPENSRQVNDRNGWCPGIKVGDIIDSPRNPVIWEA